jgi:dihydrofolate reductase
MKSSAFIATSLDGFIAREDGGLDWLPIGETGSEDGDFGYGEFIATVDALVMGRNTYDAVLEFENWPYGETNVVVVTSRPGDPPPGHESTVEFVSGEPAEVAARLAERGVEHAYVDGGKTIQHWMDAGLIQRLIITRVPVLLGTGIPLFGPLPHDIKLEHVSTRDYSNGLVQSEYRVI